MHTTNAMMENSPSLKMLVQYRTSDYNAVLVLVVSVGFDGGVVPCQQVDRFFP